MSESYIIKYFSYSFLYQIISYWTAFPTTDHTVHYRNKVLGMSCKFQPPTFISPHITSTTCLFCTPPTSVRTCRTLHEWADPSHPFLTTSSTCKLPWVSTVRVSFPACSEETFTALMLSTQKQPPRTWHRDGCGSSSSIDRTSPFSTA